ncbi:MAG: low-specificity L-threonine aldolase [Chloroflexota bacterium]
MIDVRSDTVTKPTDEMRRAMYQAEVGDDVFAEDPTVNRLEELTAEMLGKEAALFVASGTMANLVSLLSHCGRGEEVLLGAGSHIYVNEVAGMSVVGGLFPHPLPDASGCPAPAEVEAGVRAPNIHYPRTALLCLENTHNIAGGIASALETLEAVTRVARRHELALHLDGARLFNAAAALGVPARKLAAPFDSVYICLSKGLGAPVGSLTTGSRAFVERARKHRKMLGGGMRQAGIIAAAGIVALEHMIDRLPEDHRTARHIAEALAELPGIELDLPTVQTNIIRFGVTSRPAAQLSQELRARGVLINPTGPDTLRLVTHHHVGTVEADQIIAACRDILAPQAVAASAAAAANRS